MLTRNVNFEGFQYVVERKVADPCCFGSKVPRSTAPIGKALSPFQKREAPENFPRLGPGYYNTEKHKSAMDSVLKKIGSLKGVGNLASDAPRFKYVYQRVPSPTRYECGPSRTKREAKAPFGSNTVRKTFKENKLPGPGTYNIAVKKCRRTRFSQNLGNPAMINAVEMVCVTSVADTCSKCNEICPGDYWHKDYTTYLCHLCWEEEKRFREIYGERELKLFKKIRNCSFMHSHEGTTAAVRLMPQKQITKKIRLENYLSLYIEC